MAEPDGRIRVAIVGTGMAGLVTAYLLTHDEKNRYSVTLFEREDRMSLDYASVSVRNKVDGQISRIDLPMRSFAGGYYGNLQAMYDHLGIHYSPKRFEYHFSKEDTREYFIHASNNHKLPPKRPVGTSITTHVFRVLMLALCYRCFTLCCYVLRPRNDESFRQYAERIWLPHIFISLYALPLLSSVATCSHNEILLSPAIDATEYKRRTNRRQHLVVAGGVHEVQSRLAQGLDIRLGTEVHRIESKGPRVQLVTRSKEGPDQYHLKEEAFDRVVLAITPDVVGRIFEPLRESMSRIPTTTVESLLLQKSQDVCGNMVEKGNRLEIVPLRTPPTETSEAAKFGHIHTDSLFLRTRHGNGGMRTVSTHLVKCGARVLTSSVDSFSDVSPDQILHRCRFERVLRTPESRRIVNGIFETDSMVQAPAREEKKPQWRNGDCNVWLAGGWCWDGMVLLEGCIVSAMRIADDFDVRVPWKI